MMLDVVVIAMLAVTIALAISISAARFGKRYRLHRAIQIGLTICLAVTLIAFEADMRFVTDWRALAAGSPWFERGTFSVVDAALAVVEAAGGRVTVPIFEFPGGRRFHFADPDGHVLAVMQAG